MICIGAHANGYYITDDHYVDGDNAEAIILVNKVPNCLDCLKTSLWFLTDLAEGQLKPGAKIVLEPIDGD